MTNPKKKPKTGDVVGWCVVNDMYNVVISLIPGSRRVARKESSILNRIGKHGNCRVAKIVLAK